MLLRKTLSSTRIFIGLAIIIPLSAFIVENWWERHYMKLPVLETLFKDEGEKATAYNFIDQHGQQTSPALWENKVTVVNFFFTSCPTICPKMTGNMKKVQQQFGDNIRLASFTVDPERDNPARLKQYADRWNVSQQNWQFITGEKKDIYRIARKEFRLAVIDGDGGPADFIHSDQFVLIDAHQRIRGYYNGTSEKDINTLIDHIQGLLLSR